MGSVGVARWEEFEAIRGWLQEIYTLDILFGDTIYSIVETPRNRPEFTTVGIRNMTNS